MAQVNSDFPTAGLVPKKETGVTSFLTKYPKYDGRGVTIGIFDSGVDPGAAGLQVTTDGKPKIIGRYDCTGTGDVDISKVVQSTNGDIIGITGRNLKIPTTWVNPSGNYYIGVKNWYELYPKKLRERIEKERKEKSWDPGHKKALADAVRQLNNFVKKLDENKTTTMTREDKLMKDELEARVEVLQNMEKKYNDCGIVYDCIVFHDGAIWRACLDTSLTGNLSTCTLLGEYTKTYEYGTLSKSDQLNYTINVHEEDKVLEIVSFCSVHGTHVASIAAGNFPDEPEKNGVAPGANIVSYGIGDNRLDTMETGAGIVRAMVHVMRNIPTKIHVINMSYGELSHFGNSGRIGELMNDVISKYNTVWVASAGNNGPALSTISSPPYINAQCVIGVGAYVSPNMMLAEYSMRDKIPGMPYTWSSRGPTPDGAKGVTICAPGGAITSVCNFTLRGSMLLNGTSMSSPHAAGCVALLISGLLEKKLPYSPYSIKRALENTAQFVDNLDVFAQGHGLLQVEKAFEHLVTYNSEKERDVNFVVTCLNNKRGIYLRGQGLDELPREFNVYVEPQFLDSDNTEPEKKIKFQMSLALICNEPWVSPPPYLEIMNIERMFNVRVDATSLPEGVHNTTVRAYDVASIEKGPLFNIEVTVVKPTKVSKNIRGQLLYKDVEFKHNTIKRHFINVPNNVTWGVINIRGKDADKCGKIVVHCLQLKPRTSCKALQLFKVFNFGYHEEMSVGFQVEGGLVLEMTIAKYWSNVGEFTIDYELLFHGVRANSQAITMHHAEGIHTIELFGGIHPEEVYPSINLKHNVITLKPTESKVSPLSTRDIIPPSRQIYQIVLTYSFHISKATDIIINCTLLSPYLYESEYESQLWMLFDVNKQHLASGDAYHSNYNVKVDKGDYTIKLQIRHEKKDLLDKLNELPILLSQKLATPINLDIYSSISQAMINGKKLTGMNVRVDQTNIPIYVAPLPTDKLIKGTQVGQYFSGTIVYTKDEVGKKVDVYPFKYIMIENKKINNKNNNDKTKYEEYQEALRDLKTSWLSKLDPGCKEAEELYKDISEKFPDHHAVHSAMMSNLEPDNKRYLPGPDVAKSATINEKLLEVAHTVLATLNANELLAYAAIKSDQRVDAAKIKPIMESQKNVFIDALVRKASAMSRLHVLKEGKSGNGDENIPDLQEIDYTWLQLIQFVDPNELKTTSYISIWHAAAHKHYGRLLKTLLKLYDEKSTQDVDESIVWACKNLNWDFASEFYSANILIRHPNTFKSF